MILDYRVYATVYSLCLLGHCFSIALETRRFWIVQKIVWGITGLTLTANYLDWLWA